MMPRDAHSLSSSSPVEAPESSVSFRRLPPLRTCSASASGTALGQPAGVKPLTATVTEELISNILQINNDTNVDNHNNFIILLINDIIKDTYFIFENSNNKMNSLSFGSNITILKYIFSCGNPCMIDILEKFTKENFFYENFVTNIEQIFHKKLFKTEGEKEKIVFDYFGVKMGIRKEVTGSLDMPFSLESINDMITFYLKVLFFFHGF